MIADGSVVIPEHRIGRDPETGRFLPGNRVARKHGLRALSGQEQRTRHNRAGWLLKALLNDLSNDGRRLKPWEEKRARRWCELEVIADDAIREVLDQSVRDAPEKVWQMYQSAIREQGSIGRELGMSKATEERVRTADPVLEIQRLRRNG